MSFVPVAVDLPVQLAVAREQLDAMTARLREARTLLAESRDREQKLRLALADSQCALAEVTALFTDYGLGALWVRTPYIPAENLTGYIRAAVPKPWLPVNPQE